MKIYRNEAIEVTAKKNPRLPEKIKAAMKLKKTTQEKVSEIMGLNIKTLNHKINGKKEFKHSEIVMLRNILNLSNEDFTAN